MKLVFASLVAAFSVLAGAPALAQSNLEGVWLTPAKSEMTIAACGRGYCGHISKIVVPDHIKAKYGDDLLAIGTNFTDQNNKDPSLRDRPIKGLRILTLVDRGEKFEGEIYNPEDGNIYSGSVEMIDADTLKLKGCVLMVLCQDQVWVRVD